MSTLFMTDAELFEPKHRRMIGLPFRQHDDLGGHLRLVAYLILRRASSQRA